MKTSKTKTVSKTKKPSKAKASSKAVKTKKVVKSKPAPTEDEIRKKAEEIYHQRVERGEYGTALDDWHKAEELLRGS